MSAEEIYALLLDFAYWILEGEAGEGREREILDDYRRKHPNAFIPDPNGSWHIVSDITGKHIGPFTTELDCAFARSIATREWSTGIVMDRSRFYRHLGFTPTSTPDPEDTARC